MNIGTLALLALALIGCKGAHANPANGRPIVDDMGLIVGYIGYGDYDPSPTSTTPIGKSCDTVADCEGSHRKCFGEDSGYSGGYCSQDCRYDTDCPSGSTCIIPAVPGEDFYAGSCYQTCSPFAPCRDGYTCVTSEEFSLVDATCRPGTRPPPPPTPTAQSDCATAPPGVAATGVASTVLSGDGHLATEVAIAASVARHEIIVGWHDYFDYYNSGAVVSASTDNGATFLPRGAIDESSGFNYRDLTFAVNDAGSYYAAQHNGSTDIISLEEYGAVSMESSTDGVKWNGASGVIELGRLNHYIIDSPSLAVAPDQTVWTLAAAGLYHGHVIARELFDPKLNYDPEFPATTLVDGSNDPAWLDHPLIVFAADGTALVAWLSIGGDPNGDAANTVWLQRFASDATPLGDAVRASSPGDAPVDDRPSLALVGDSVVVAFTSGQPAAWTMRAAIADQKTLTFAPSWQVDAPSPCAMALHPTLGVSGDAVSLFYYRSDGGNGGVYQTRITHDDGNWQSQSTTRLSTAPFALTLEGNSAIARRLGVATVGDQFTVVWTEPRAGIATAHVAMVQP